MIFEANFAPMLAVKTLVNETSKTIGIFTYPIEYSGRVSLKLPVIIKIITPGKAIKKPITADVPTASWIFLENIVSTGTVKLPPPIPIKTDKNPIIELIKKLIILDEGISLDINRGSCCKPIFIDIIKAKKIKMIIKISPEIILASKDPIMEPNTIPKTHFFTILILAFPNIEWDLIEESDVKHIVPKEEATATCIAVSIEYPKLIKIKYVIGTIIMPPPTPNNPAKKPTRRPVDKKINIKYVNNFSVLKVQLM